MKLIDAIVNISYDSNWGIWAELDDGELTEESEARYGSKEFDNGGVLDGFVFVCNGETVGDHIASWTDDDGDLIYGWFESFIDPINEGKPWLGLN